LTRDPIVTKPRFTEAMGGPRYVPTMFSGHPEQ
jgi:hypothetical protein